MGTRAQHPSVLSNRTRAMLVIAFTMCVVGVARPADAHNSWTGGYRKFPWKAGTSIGLSTLPGQCPHCSGRESSSAWKAIDALMYYDTVYSVSPGTVDAAVASGGGAGMYMRVKDSDGTYITYEHLSEFLVTSGSVVAGQPIAVSGASGNVTGAHLHFQRQNGTSFSSTALDLTPLSGHGGSSDSLTSTEYVSDNAGIGYSSAGNVSTTMQTLYKSLGGYSGGGVTADIGDSWTPCENEGIVSTAFRYACSPRSGIAGSIQTLVSGSTNRQRAMLHRSGASSSYVLHRGILGAYTRTYDGHDWVYWLGYPVSARYLLPNRGVYQQDFQHGSITYATGSCVTTVYLSGVNKQQTSYCD